VVEFTKPPLLENRWFSSSQKLHSNFLGHRDGGIPMFKELEFGNKGRQKLEWKIERGRLVLTL